MNTKPHDNVTSDLRRALKECISLAEQWRGYYVGDPDVERMPRFDATIRKAKSAVKILDRGGKWK